MSAHANEMPRHARTAMAPEAYAHVVGGARAQETIRKSSAG